MSSLRLFLSLLLALWSISRLSAEPVPGTKALTREGDLAAQMVAGIDKYLMRELAASVEKRKAFWKPDYSSPEAYTRSVQTNREHLRRILGVVDGRLPVKELEYVATSNTPSLVAETKDYTVRAVRWPVFEGVDGEGLLLEPKGKPRESANLRWVVAIPDADWTPEMFVGLAPGVPKEAQFARHLAEGGSRVLVPVLLDRKDTWSGNPKLSRMTNQPHREFVYRMAFEMGRHIIGYELQKVVAAVDWLTPVKDHPPVMVMGYGEGGLLALYCAAVDTRIDETLVSGSFGPREAVWQEPIYRNVWSLLRQFGDAELAALANPTGMLLVEHSRWPQVNGPPPVRANRSGAAPGQLLTPEREAIKREWLRATKIDYWHRGDYLPSDGPWRGIHGPWREALENKTDLPGHSEVFNLANEKSERKPPLDNRNNFDPAPRQKRQLDQLVAHTQKLMRNSESVRKDFFWSKLDTSSREKYQASCQHFRKQFWEEVIGKLPEPTEPANPRTRRAYDEPKWKGYEVTLDLYPDVFAYGILLVPKDLKPGEKRPVVVCQHGLEGRPQDVVNPKERSKYYNSFGAQLADQGYIVYAPQNPYIGQDKFRVLQRKANPLGLSLFSFIVRQHERTLDWLAGLPFVDPERIAFYGLSYGGKTAMRVPAILPRYCLSICSGDFNEWIWKNVSVDFPGSYMFTGEYEMYEFNLGNTFNYAEMAALIAPRPFMVERGHDDGVGIDEWVAYEYAKVRRLYAKLGVPERTEIEFFPGGHMINGKGTFAFLQKHLKWPK